MAGTREGGKKASKTNKEKYGEDFYINCGRKGGTTHHPETRWFAMHPELARKCGAKGGKISKRGCAKKSVE